MLTVIAYDVSDDTRRCALARELLNYGRRVQESVFECYVESEQLDKLRASIETIIDISTDNIRFYYLCAKDRDKITVGGIRNDYRDDDYFMV